VFATIIGAYPDIPEAATEDERLSAVLGDQLEAGLGMLSDGRVYRAAEDPASVVDAWRVADRVGHHLAACEGLEPPLIKACLVGPWTAGEGEPTRVRVAADALGVAVDSLFEAGAPVVQLTEPAIGSIDDRDGAAVDLLTEVLAGLVATVGDDRHLSLALAGGGPTAVPAERLVLGFSSYLLDLIASPDDWRVCARVPRESGLIAGVVDARAARSGAAEVGIWGARYAASMGGRGPARTGICPGAGIERLDRTSARALLAFTAEVARKADLPDAQLMQEVDPATVSARSAAIGRAEPRPRGRRPGRP
jgi:hypothetical protein